MSMAFKIPFPFEIHSFLLGALLSHAVYFWAWCERIYIYSFLIFPPILIFNQHLL